MALNSMVETIRLPFVLNHSSLKSVNLPLKPNENICSARFASTSKIKKAVLKNYITKVRVVAFNN